MQYLFEEPWGELHGGHSLTGRTEFREKLQQTHAQLQFSKMYTRTPNVQIT